MIKNKFKINLINFFSTSKFKNSIYPVLYFTYEAPEIIKFKLLYLLENVKKGNIKQKSIIKLF